MVSLDNKVMYKYLKIKVLNIWIFDFFCYNYKTHLKRLFKAR